jgi:hypothetical protein
MDFMSMERNPALLIEPRRTKRAQVSTSLAEGVRKRMDWNCEITYKPAGDVS